MAVRGLKSGVVLEKLFKFGMLQVLPYRNAMLQMGHITSNEIDLNYFRNHKQHWILFKNQVFNCKMFYFSSIAVRM